MANPVRVPDDTRSIQNIGNFILDYQPYMNAFSNALVNRIAKVMVTSRLWDNPLAQFKKGKLELGETVEEIFVNIAKTFSYDPSTAEAEVFKRELPDVRAAYHSMNYQKFYKVTISREQLAQAFLSYDSLNSLVSSIVESLYTAMNFDEFLTAKYMLCREALNGGIYVVTVDAIEGDGANPDDSIEKFREYTNNLTFYKTLYNRAGVRTHTPVDSQSILMGNHAESVLGVQVLANAFNITQVDYISKRVAIDSFTFDADDEARLAEIFKKDSTYVPFTDEEKSALASIVALKIDNDYIMQFDNLELPTQMQNGEGVYWNYFLHAWKTFSVSPFHNAVLFTTQDTSITGVTVTPATANVTLGSSMAMSAAVKGTGIYEKAVTWSIVGKSTLSSGTNIDGTSGVLHVAADETVGNVITVTATAKDGTKGTATITVTK